MEAADAVLPPEERLALEALSRALGCEVVPHPERTVAKRPDLRAFLSDEGLADIEVTRDLAHEAWAPRESPLTAREVTPEAVAPWCTRLLASDKYSDIAQKFVDDTVSHRWAFIYATSFPTDEADAGIAAALESGLPLPSEPPTLPSPLTGVWIAAGERLIRWTADQGWREAHAAHAASTDPTQDSRRHQSS